MAEQEIPALVRAQLDIHRVETLMKLETVKRQLEGVPITAVQSRRLRAQRDLLTADLTAWEYLLRVERPSPVAIMSHAEYQKTSPNPHCTVCGHCPHGADGCGAPMEAVCTCQCTGIAPEACERCRHAHVQGVACTVRVLEGTQDCGCTA